MSEPLAGEYLPGCTCRNPWRENAFTEGFFPCAVFPRLLSSVVCDPERLPGAQAPFVRYRSLTLSAVQLLTGESPVSSTDTMELPSGIAKADNPMASMHLDGLRSTKDKCRASGISVHVQVSGLASLRNSFGCANVEWLNGGMVTASEW